jgi:hypothetical protein
MQRTTDATPGGRATVHIKNGGFPVSRSCFAAPAAFALLLLSGCGGSDNALSSQGAQPLAQENACDAYAGPALTSLVHYEGTMHEHSAYSDGDIHHIPRDYLRIVREAGYSYAGSSEHSDTLDTGVFISLGADCFTTPDGLLTCLTPSVDSLVKWRSTASQVEEATQDGFLGIRGFEWTSDRFGHINVYFFSNAKTDLGYLVTMETFWSWFTRAPDSFGLGGSITAPVPFGGGGDGLAHFNHPGDKCLTDGDPGCNWNDFKLVPGAVERMFGIELYNSGGRRGRYESDWMRALDKGWRLSPIGSEDEHETKYGSEERAKTVTVATALTEEGFKEAWLARRTYALVSGRHLRAELNAAGHPMGSTLNCDSGSAVPLDVRVTETDGSAFKGELVLLGSGGSEIAHASGDRLQAKIPVDSSERWYFVRVNNEEGESVAYLAPIWIRPRAN